MSLQNDDSNPPPIMSSEVAYSCAYVHTHFEHIPRRKLGKEWQHDQAASAGPSGQLDCLGPDRGTRGRKKQFYELVDVLAKHQPDTTPMLLLLPSPGPGFPTSYWRHCQNPLYRQKRGLLNHSDVPIQAVSEILLTASHM